MKLTHSQKKYIKKNYKKLALSEIASKLNINEVSLKEYIEFNWPNKKKVVQNPIPTGIKSLILKNYKFLLILALLIFAVYANSIKGEFLSDDIRVIIDDKSINTPAYYLGSVPPFFNLRSFILHITHLGFGNNPIPYHLINIFFHVGTTLCLFLILLYFFPSPIPFICSIFFAVHPLLTEAVTWIAGGPYVQYSFFAIFSLLTFIIYINQKKKLYYYVSLFSFILCLFSSEKSVSLSLIFISLALSQNQLKNLYKKILPYFALNMLWVIIYLTRVGQVVNNLQTDYYSNVSSGSTFIKNLPVSISYYLMLTVWPKSLSFYHTEMIFSKLQYLVMIIVIFSMSAYLIYSFFKNKRMFFWLSLFFISIMPTSSPFGVAWVVAERYVYLGVAGLLVVITVFITKISNKINKKAVYFICAIIIVALSARTFIRNIDWKNQDNLWLASAKTSPSSPQNHNNLGDYYSRHGNHQKAIEEFNFAIKLLPNYADAYNNVANVYMAIGNTNLAEYNYLKAVSFQSKLWQSNLNLGIIYYSKNDYNQAMNYLKRSIDINPNYADTHVALGATYLKLGLIENAKKEASIALQLEPNNPKAKSLYQLKF